MRSSYHKTHAAIPGRMQHVWEAAIFRIWISISIYRFSGWAILHWRQVLRCWLLLCQALGFVIHLFAAVMYPIGHDGKRPEHLSRPATTAGNPHDSSAYPNDLPNASSRNNNSNNRIMAGFKHDWCTPFESIWPDKLPFRLHMFATESDASSHYPWRKESGQTVFTLVSYCPCKWKLYRCLSTESCEAYAICFLWHKSTFP